MVCLSGCVPGAEFVQCCRVNWPLLPPSVVETTFWLSPTLSGCVCRCAEFERFITRYLAASAPLPPLKLGFSLSTCRQWAPMGKGAGKGGSLANAGGCCSEPSCKSFPGPTPCGTCYWEKAASSPPSSSQSSGSSAAAPRIATCAAASATRVKRGDQQLARRRYLCSASFRWETRKRIPLTGTNPPEPVV